MYLSACQRIIFCSSFCWLGPRVQTQVPRRRNKCYYLLISRSHPSYRIFIGIFVKWYLWEKYFSICLSMVCMHVYMYVHVYIRRCACMCSMEAEIDGGCFCEAGSFLMNPKLAGFGSLVRQFALGIPCLCHLSSVPTSLHHFFLAFI